jgi:hypothetical protein
MTMLLEPWAPTGSLQADEHAALAEQYDGGPLILLTVARIPAGSWAALVELKDEFGSWREFGFETREGAQAWAERQVDALRGVRS